MDRTTDPVLSAQFKHYQPLNRHLFETHQLNPSAKAPLARPTDSSHKSSQREEPLAPDVGLKLNPWCRYILKMPTYDYTCDKCGHGFEFFQSMSEKPLESCPKDRCGMKRWGKGKVKRGIGGGAGLIFKGSGFYITDYRSENYKAGAKKDSTSSNTSAAGSSSSASTSSSGSTGSETPKKASTTPKKESS